MQVRFVRALMLGLVMSTFVVRGHTVLAASMVVRNFHLVGRTVLRHYIRYRHVAYIIRARTASHGIRSTSSRIWIVFACRTFQGAVIDLPCVRYFIVQLGPRRGMVSHPVFAVHRHLWTPAPHKLRASAFRLLLPFVSGLASRESHGTSPLPWWRSLRARVGGLLLTSLGTTGYGY